MRKHTKKIISLLLGFTMAVCMFLMPGVATRAEAANSIPEFRSSISHSMKTQTGGKLIPADTVLADAPNCVVVVTGTVENIGTASEMGTTGTKIIVEIDSNIPGNLSDIKGTFHNYIPGGSPEAYDVSVAGSYDYSNRTVTFDFGDGQYGCSLFNNPGDSFEFEIGIIRVPYVSDSYDFVNTVYVQHDDVYSGSEILTGTGRTRTAESIDSFKSQRLESAAGRVYIYSYDAETGAEINDASYAGNYAYSREQLVNDGSTGPHLNQYYQWVNIGNTGFTGGGKNGWYVLRFNISDVYNSSHTYINPSSYLGTKDCLTSFYNAAIPDGYVRKSQVTRADIIFTNDGTVGYVAVPYLNKSSLAAKKVPISKRLIQNGDATIPDMSFGFTFEQKSEWEGVQYVSKDTNPTPIAEKSVTITDADRYTGTDSYVGDLTGKKLYYGEYENVLDDFNPQVPGTYLYLVKEKMPNPKLPSVTYTESEYVLKIEVDSNKEIVDIPTITLYKDSAGKAKADYTDAGIDPPKVFDEKQDLIFYNIYTTTGGTTPTGIMTNILPFIIIGGAGVGGLTLYVVLNVRRKRKEIS